MNPKVATDLQLPTVAPLDSLAPLVGRAFFDALTRLLCSDFGADVAFVARYDEKRDMMKTLSFFQDGVHQNSLEYALENSPCSGLLAGDLCLYLKDVQSQFPSAQFLKDQGIQAYIGIPLGDGDGNVTGALAVECRHALDEGDALLSVMESLKARVGTEFLHYQNANKSREALSQALLLNYSKSMFMANISHELRTPLGAMVGYASLIRDRQIDPKAIKTYAGQICTSGEELLALIGDIMSLAMLEISEETSHREKFDLLDIARTGRRLIQQQAAGKNLTVMAATRSDALIVTGDASHTKKALMNLLTNAVKYTSRGQIRLEVTVADDGSARLSVTDTGVGMTAEQAKEACKPLGSFTQAYDMHQEGSGLGLPITSLLMQRQGGTLYIESNEGKGTTAHLVFPKELVQDEEGDFI